MKKPYRLQSHGMSNRRGTCEFRTYRAWQMMKQRCTNPKTNGYDQYGGIGIRYAPEWEKFDAFLADVGVAPSTRHSLDRINGGDYRPGNVRWATTQEQQSNLKSNHYITFSGETATCAEWARRSNISRQGFAYWIKAFGEQRAVEKGLIHARQ